MTGRPSWNSYQALLAVLEEGSLSGAARRLCLSHPTVRGRLADLEAGLGAVLFTRGRRGMVPTEAAHELRDALLSMDMAAQRVNRTAANPPGQVAGVVRLGVPEIIGTEIAPPMLARLRRRHPALRIELSLSNRVEDVLAQEVDVALRTVRPSQGILVTRKVAERPLGFFASASYLDRRGQPATFDDLKDHDMIGPDRSAPEVERAMALGFDGAQAALRTDSHPAQLAAIRAGLGIGAMQTEIAARDANLRRVLPDFELMRLTFWAVTHGDLRTAPRVRSVMDALAAPETWR